MRLAIAAFALWWASAFYSGGVFAADVLVVRSEDSPAVLEVQRAVVEGLAGRGASARTVGVLELDENESGSERVWVAIGEDAAVRIHDLRRPDILLAHCLVADPDYIGLDPFEFPGVNCNAPIKNQVDLIREILPDAKVIGALVREGSEEGQARVQELSAALPEGMTVETVVVSADAPFSVAVKELLSRRIDLVWTFPDEALFNEVTTKSLLLSCLRKRKPVYGYSQEVVRAGALFGVTMDSQAQGRAVADLAFTLLSHPGMGPQAASRFRDPSAASGTIALNLSVAHVLGREIPAALVNRAKYVVTP
ncbi:MAG TPA: ABC transporter substrate binding protein [bacterium]|nr:ABC transporter substrate binding protein [bacterium]